MEKYSKVGGEFRGEGGEIKGWGGGILEKKKYKRHKCHPKINLHTKFCLKLTMGKCSNPEKGMIWKGMTPPFSHQEKGGSEDGRVF